MFSNPPTGKSNVFGIAPGGDLMAYAIYPDERRHVFAAAIRR
jgi:hypothetical protein